MGDDLCRQCSHFFCQGFLELGIFRQVVEGPAQRQARGVGACDKECRQVVDELWMGEPLTRHGAELVSDAGTTAFGFTKNLLGPLEEPLRHSPSGVDAGNLPKRKGSKHSRLEGRKKLFHVVDDLGLTCLEHLKILAQGGFANHICSVQWQQLLEVGLTFGFEVLGDLVQQLISHCVDGRRIGLHVLGIESWRQHTPRSLPIFSFSSEHVVGEFHDGLETTRPCDPHGAEGQEVMHRLPGADHHLPGSRHVHLVNAFLAVLVCPLLQLVDHLRSVRTQLKHDVA
mmetsp:Transcript_47134/g.110206  ORF Transcript_47134/g.110206 Transcript_47134/m.110206 type:complete len:284 (-) Transcript_47134:109-960(-)